MAYNKRTNLHKKNLNGKKAGTRRRANSDILEDTILISTTHLHGIIDEWHKKRESENPKHIIVWSRNMMDRYAPKSYRELSMRNAHECVLTSMMYGLICVYEMLKSEDSGVKEGLKDTLDKLYEIYTSAVKHLGHSAIGTELGSMFNKMALLVDVVDEFVKSNNYDLAEKELTSFFNSLI